jgi:hypothetical protein
MMEIPMLLYFLAFPRVPRIPRGSIPNPRLGFET